MKKLHTSVGNFSKEYSSYTLVQKSKSHPGAIGSVKYQFKIYRLSLNSFKIISCAFSNRCCVKIKSCQYPPMLGGGGDKF